MLNGRKEEADDGLDVKEEHQLDALQPASFVSNSNISSSSSSSSSRKKVRVCLPKAFAPGRCRPIGAQLRLARRARGLTT